MEDVIRENGDLIIPKTVFDQTNFKPGQKVIINIESGKIVISPDNEIIMERFKVLSKKINLSHIDSDELHEQMIDDRFGTA